MSEGPRTSNRQRLTLRLRRRQAERLGRELGASDGGEASGERVVRTWYDTPDRRLSARDVELRVCDVGGRRVQTVRADGSRGAPCEWVDEIAGERPDLSVVADDRVREFLTGEPVRESLEAVFVADVLRTRGRLRLDDGVEVACAIDVGELRNGEVKQAIREAELELESGEPAALLRLAGSLQRRLDLRLEPRSLWSRGYALSGRPEAPPKLALPPLDPRGSSEEAFRRVARTCLANLCAHGAYVLVGGGPRGVHQARVAARRLRSTIGLLREALPADLSGRLGRELRWSARRLARARDWDVFMTETLEPLRASLPEDERLAVLASYAIRARARAYRRARRAIESPRYTRMVLDLGVWLESPDWTALDPEVDARRLARPILGQAKALLDGSYGAVREAGAEILDLEPRELHALRIRVKRLRYTAEPFVSLFQGPLPETFVSALRELQDQLGHLQDVSVTSALLEKLARDAGRRADRTTLRAAAAIVSGWQSSGSRQTRRRLLATWARFGKLDPFWR